MTSTVDLKPENHHQPDIIAGDLVLDSSRRTVDVAGYCVHLTNKEFEILELLARQEGQAISVGMFLEQLYEFIDTPKSRIIDVYVCMLRKKLAAVSNGHEYIQKNETYSYTLCAR